MNARIVGRFAAVLLVVAVAIIILISWASSRTPNASPVTTTSPPPDIENDWSESPLAGARPEQLVRAGEKWTWRHLAENGRLEYLIEAERLDPLERGRFALTSPVAWIYPADGGRIRINADAGELLWPRGGEPESGDLTGDVTILQYEEDDEEPSITLTTDTLIFERTLGQVEAPGEVSIEGDQFSFLGDMLTIRVSEYTKPDSGAKRHRLNLVRIERGRELRYRPSNANTSESDRTRTNMTRQTTPSTPGEIDYYRALFAGDVVLARAGQRLRAEKAEIHALTINSDLPTDAVRPIRFREVFTATTTDGNSTPPRATPSPSGTSSADEEIILTWNGPFELRPIQERPDELNDTKLAVRFFSPESSKVTLEDESSGLKARGASLEYAASTAKFDLSGIAGEFGVNILLPDQAELTAGRVTLDLEHSPLGMVAVTSPGIIRSLATNPGSDPTEIRWIGRAEVAFEIIDPPNDDPEVLLREISVSDEVIAAAPNLSLASNSVHAIFTPNEQVNALDRLSATGEVLLTLQDSGSIRADTIDSFFESSADNQPLLTRAVATGGARAEGIDGWIEAQRLHARFASSSASRDPELIWFEADTRVTASDSKGLTIEASMLRADLADSSAEIIGAPARIEQIRDDGTYALSAESIAMADTTEKVERAELSASSLRRQLTVFGAGDATYTADPARNAREHAKIEWKDSMQYDAIAGRVEIDGDVRAHHTPSPFEEQTGTADSAEITLVPYTEAREHVNPDTGEPLTILAVQLDASADSPAETVIRRYAPTTHNADARRYVGLIALRSARIQADATHQTLETPGPGLLVIEDRGDPEDEKPHGSSTLASGDIRGTSVFEWKKSMTFNRREGEAEMLQSVKIRHLPPDSRDPTVLVCEHVQAFFSPLDSTRNARPTLDRLIARQAVYLWHQKLQLIADAIEYKAGQEEINIDAIDSNRVTIHNTETGQHLTADRIVVDRNTGEWRAIGGAGSGVITGNTIRETQ